MLFLILTLVLGGLLIFYSNSLYGLHGDPFGTLYSFWWQKYASLNHLNLNFNNLLNFPFGVDLSSPLPQSLAGIIAKYLSILFNEVTAYNLIILLSFVLTFIFGYWLTFKLIDNKAGALLSALIITFAPYHLAQASQHLTLANIHWLVLFALILLNMFQKPTWFLGFLAAFSFSLTVLDGYLYGLFALVILAVWLLARLIWALICKEIRINRKNLLIYLFSLVFALALIQVFSPHLIKNIIKPAQLAEATGTERTFEELAVYSAKTYNFFLPPPNNPILGQYTQKIYQEDIAQSGSNITEQTLYLGWIPILLTFLGLFLYLKNKNFRQERLSFLIIFSILLALAGFYFSFAPMMSIFGLKISTPAAWLFHYLPFIRVYARFGFLVMLAVAILAGLGLSLILKSVKSVKLKYLLFFIFFLLIFLEFANFPPWPAVDVSPKAMPVVYQWLKEQPGTDWAVAEYPLLPNDEPKSYDYLIWQRFHQKPLIYGARVGSEGGKKRKEIINPGDPQTIAQLKERQVKFIIIHKDSFTPENAKKYPQEYNYGKIPDLTKRTELKLVKQFDETDVYEIIP